MNQLTDVMIYTKVKLSDNQFNEISHRVKAIEGVERFDRSPHQGNFILIAYRAGKVRALTILNKFTRLGFNASLVAM